MLKCKKYTKHYNTVIGIASVEELEDRDTFKYTFQFFEDETGRPLSSPLCVQSHGYVCLTDWLGDKILMSTVYTNSETDEILYLALLLKTESGPEYLLEIKGVNHESNV